MTGQITIREWVERNFAGPEAKVFLELGAHQGEDTQWLAALPNVNVVAFEPDPRDEIPSLPNVALVRAAVSDLNGAAPFVLSESGWGKPWTHSSSLRKPKNHLTRFPVQFGETVMVEALTLDRFFAPVIATTPIDFIWCDIQGAEGDMIRGAKQTLEQTHYLYMEYSNDEMYEGQPKLDELLAMIPQFRIIELWSEDVLLENRNWQQKRRAA